MRFGRISAVILVLGSGASAQAVDPLAPRPAALAMTAAPSVPASVTGFEAYKLQLAARARREGIRETTISEALTSLTLDERVIRLDRGQPGGVSNPNAFPPFAPYKRDHVTPALIGRGKAVYADVASHVGSIQARTGVDPFVMLAIFGHETSYGTVTGNFDLVRSLASLAYEGRRRPMFEDEFVATLKLMERGWPRWRLKGSWAGATGYPQFMPTKVLSLAIDGDDDGVANIWSSRSDGLASIGNYMKSAGWKAGVGWGVAARVPLQLNRVAIRNPSVAPRCPRVFERHSQWKTLREWRALGVQPLGSTRMLPEDEPLSLIEPDGPYATAYLTSHNYRMILDYNCSNFYALSVGLLADAIAGR